MMMRKGSMLLPVADGGKRPSIDARRMSIRGSLTSGEPGSDSLRRQSNVPGLARSSFTARGPSLIGLLASKRLAKKLTSRFFADRRQGRQASVKKEPTYRMEPTRKFCPDMVERIIQETLSNRLSTMRYSPRLCANMTSILTDEIKDKVKALNFDRYKIVCTVVLGQKQDQGVLVSSRAAWDADLDNYASYTFENEHVFCSASVFGVYAE